MLQKLQCLRLPLSSRRSTFISDSLSNVKHSLLASMWYLRLLRDTHLFFNCILPTCPSAAFWFSYFLLLISVSADLWLSWLCSYMCRQCLCVAAFTLNHMWSLSADRRSVFHHAGLLQCLLAFLHTGKDIPLLWGDWKSVRSPAHLCLLGQFPMLYWKAGTWEDKNWFSEDQDYNPSVNLAHFP